MKKQKIFLGNLRKCPTCGEMELDREPHRHNCCLTCEWFRGHNESCRDLSDSSHAACEGADPGICAQCTPCEKYRMGLPDIAGIPGHGKRRYSQGPAALQRRVAELSWDGSGNRVSGGKMKYPLRRCRKSWMKTRN